MESLPCPIYNFHPPQSRSAEVHPHKDVLIWSYDKGRTCFSSRTASSMTLVQVPSRSS